MSTPISDVAGIFLSLINDNRLTNLIVSSGSTSFETYVQPWLLQAIDDFDICIQDLTYDSTTQIFSTTLTQQSKNILAQIMVKYWLEREVQDVLQMRSKIQDRDFKTFSESASLKEKQNSLNIKREEVSQLLVSYGLKHNSWASWKNQEFD